MIARMDSFTHVPIRERIRRTLAGSPQPLTGRRLAELVDTTPPQALRALRRLENEGAVVCRLAAGGRYEWTTSGSPQTGR